MKWVVGFLRFWRDFIIGDDPVIAGGIVLLLAVAAILHAIGMSSWWLLPPAVAGLLALSLRRAP